MPELEVDGCRLDFSAEGPKERPALLFMHALGSTRALWDSQLPALERRFRIVRYDARGHGASSAAPGEYTLDRLGRDALAILDAVGVERAHLCGLSLGGMTAMWLARHAPERTGRIVLANTAARIGTAALWQERMDLVRTQSLAPVAETAPQRWFTEEFGRQHPAVIARCRQMLLEGSPEGYAACAAALRDADLRGELGRIAPPALVVTGRFDPVTPPSDAAVLCRDLPDARGLELQAAHFSNIERAEEFNSALLEFLTA